MGDANQTAAQRWRLILGQYAKKQLPVDMSKAMSRMEQSLDFLYGREYEGRGVRGRGGQGGKGPGSLDPSQLNVPEWLNEVRTLFPRETQEIIEKHAMDRYGLSELVTDKAALEKMEPNQDLLKMMLQFKGQMKGEVLQLARDLVRKIVEELREKLAKEVQQTFSGRLNRYRHSPMRISQNFDWKGTLRRNLKNWQADTQQLVLEDIRFFSRNRRRMTWQVILCVDQSGSMVDSVIHSAVLAGILAGLPAVTVKLVVFDTSVVDLSGSLDDPVELLMSVQLGGGTDIGQALCYCEELVETPQRTVLALISDFCEGAPPSRMLGAVKRLREAGVTLIGLAALDSEATGCYDEHMAHKLADLGMNVTAATPRKFAEWLANIMS